MRYLNYTILTLVLSLSLTGCGENKAAIVPTVVETASNQEQAVPVIDQSADTMATDSLAADQPTQAETAGYTLADVAEHNKSNDCWQAIDGKVYDVTSFVPAHPGGPTILKGCGVDATDMYNKVEKHKNAAGKLAEFLIGNLK